MNVHVVAKLDKLEGADTTTRCRGYHNCYFVLQSAMRRLCADTCLAYEASEVRNFLATEVDESLRVRRQTA